MPTSLFHPHATCLVHGEHASCSGPILDHRHLGCLQRMAELEASMTLRCYHACHGLPSSEPPFHERVAHFSVFKGSLPLLLTLILGTRPGTECMRMSHSYCELNISPPWRDRPCKVLGWHTGASTGCGEGHPLLFLHWKAADVNSGSRPTRE